MKYIPLLVLLMITTPLFSQKNYIPGYAISLKGDTIRGEVDYQAWNFNPNVINFKTSPQQDIFYTPSDILSFEANNEIYESARIKVEIGQEAQQEFKEESTFLLTLARGKKSLYSYKDKTDGKERFYIKKDSASEPLIYKAYYKTRADGSEVLVENKTFIGQLTIYLQECPSVMKKVSSLKYQKNSLINIFRDYYECAGAGNILPKANLGVVFSKGNSLNEYGFLFGATLTSVKFSGDMTPAGFPALIGPNYNQSVQPSFGFFYNSVFRGNRNKTALSFELLYTTFKVSGSYNSPPSYHPSITSYSQTGATEIRLNAFFRYKQPIGKSFLLFNAGPTYGYSLSQTNQLNATYGSPMDGSRKREFGLAAGVGYQKEKTSFIFRIEKSNGFSPYASLGESITRFYFLIGYTLSRPKNAKK